MADHKNTELENNIKEHQLTPTEIENIEKYLKEAEYFKEIITIYEKTPKLSQEVTTGLKKYISDCQTMFARKDKFIDALSKYQVNTPSGEPLSFNKIIDDCLSVLEIFKLSYRNIYGHQFPITGEDAGLNYNHFEDAVM